MHLVLFILIAGLCLCGADSRSETANKRDDYNSRLWQMEDGLPNNTVQAITQTPDGYLWVGTREGLARFDGVGFEKFDLLAGHPLLSITCLHKSRDGSLWIGTDSFGLFHRAGRSIERIALPNGNQDFDVREMCEGGDGTLWITSGGEVFHYAGGRLERRAKLRRIQQGLCTDSSGAVWTVGNAMIRLDAQGPTNSISRPGSLPFVSRCLYCDPSGVFWMSDGDNLIQLKDGTVKNWHKPAGPSGYVSVIYRNQAGELWVGSYLGLRRFINGTFVSQGEPDAPSYRIYAIFEDRERNLWVGSEEGLLRLTPKTFKTITKKDGLTVNTIVTVCASRDGGVWISPWGFGLNHWVDGRITSLSRTNGLSSDYIMAMTEGRDGSLWAGADNGGALNHIQNGRITTYGQEQGFTMSPSTATTALFEDERGALWIGSRELLQCRVGDHFDCFTTKDGVSDQKINAICGGTNGVVWIGTEGGLTRWQNGRFENLAATNARLRILILSLHEDAAGSLWIGTKGNGLLKLENGLIHEFTSAQGLFSDAIYAILEDDHDNLWLNSSRGIFRLEKKQLEEVAAGRLPAVTSISYGKADGILSSGQYQDVTQPSACKSADGRLWFRTTQGIAVVDPQKISRNELPPPVVIQAVIADKQAVGNPILDFAPDVKINIPPGRGELEVHYEALSFRAPEKNQFRFKLAGVDLNWVEAGARRVAFYNNLKPGNYRFQVLACNNDGVWSETGAAVELNLQPHFWQTWWFLLLVILGTFTLVGGTVRYVTRQRMLRRLERLERQNAVEQERARIARDMHDELGAKLTRISFQGDTARRCASNSAETNQHIGKMSETARELILSLDQIVWAVDPENDSLENLANYICRYASEFAADSPLQCKFKIPWKLPNCPLSTDVRHNVFLAVKEALNNAVKHSGATELTLTISARAEEFEISVADNGRGLGTPLENEPGKQRRTGRGLGNMRERLVSIYGQFEIKSAPCGGTEVRLIIPLGKTSTSYVYPN